MDTEIIKLTKDNYKDYQLNEVVALSIAESGAMGEPGNFEIVTNKGEVYIANPLYDSISLQAVFEFCPILFHIRIGTMGCISKPNGWQYLYLEFGNHLFINDSIYTQFQIGVKYVESKRPYFLYNEWMGIVQDIVGNKIYSKELDDKLKGVICGQPIGDATSKDLMADEEMAWKYPHDIKDYSDIFQDSHRKRWKVDDKTDDTDMMQCIANDVIKDKGENLTSIAQDFKECAEGEPKDIGENTYKDQYQEIPDDLPFVNVKRTRALLKLALLFAIILIAVGFLFLPFYIMLIIVLVVFAPLLIYGVLLYSDCEDINKFPREKLDASRLVNDAVGFDLGNQFKLYRTAREGYYENLIVIDNNKDFESFKKHLDSIPDIGDKIKDNGLFIRHSYKGIEGNGFYLCDSNQRTHINGFESIEVDYFNQTIKHIFSRNEDYLS